MGSGSGAESELYLVQKDTNQYVHVTHTNFHIGRAEDVVDFTVHTKNCYLGNDHAYLLIDWQGAKQAEQRDYRQAENCYASAVEKYRQAQANGTEDTQMAVLKNLIDQLRTSGWLK